MMMLCGDDRVAAEGEGERGRGGEGREGGGKGGGRRQIFGGCDVMNR